MEKSDRADTYTVTPYDLEHAIAVTRLVHAADLPHGTLAEIVAATGYGGNIRSLYNMVRAAQMYGLLSMTFDPAVLANRVAVTLLAGAFLPPIETIRETRAILESDDDAD